MQQSTDSQVERSISVAAQAASDTESLSSSSSSSSSASSLHTGSASTSAAVAPAATAQAAAEASVRAAEADDDSRSTAETCGPADAPASPAPHAPTATTAAAVAPAAPQERPAASPDAGAGAAVAAPDAVDDETEDTLAMALQEMRRHRARLHELEELVRHLSVQYGLDPESLLTPEVLGSAPGSKLVLRHGPCGLRAAVRTDEDFSGSARASVFIPDGTARAPPAPRTPPAPAPAPSSSSSAADGDDDDNDEDNDGENAEDDDELNAGAPEPSESARRQQQQQMVTEMKVANIMSKLQRLTGRKMSLEEIGPLLVAATPDEALRNGRLLRTADHLKRIYGGRPDYILPAPATPAAAPTAAAAAPTAEAPSTGSPSPAARPAPADTPAAAPHDAALAGDALADGCPHTRTRRSRSFFKPPVGGDADGDAAAAGAALEGAEAACQPTPSVTLGRKIDKLSKLTGRRGSLSEIRPLLDSRTVEQARTNAQSLYAVEKLKKRYGDRPMVDTAATAATAADVRSPRSPTAPSAAGSSGTAPGTPRAAAAAGTTTTSPPGTHKRRKNKDRERK